MPLNLLAQLAWRNLGRHRRRNGMLLGAIALAVAGVVLLNAMLRGMEGEIREVVLDSLTGHVKVLGRGYLADPGVQHAFDLPNDWPAGLDSVDVLGWAARLRVPAVVMSERETRGVELVGVDPNHENISFLGRAAVSGERLAGTDDRRLLLGRALVDQLRTAVGRRVVLVTQGADGRAREVGYRVAGVYESDFNALEKVYVFTGAAALQRTLGTTAVTEVSVRLASAAEARQQAAAAATLAMMFAGLDVLRWQELAPQAAAMVAMADFGVFIYFVVVMGALVFGLVNAMATAVMERVREMGMLRAVGMRPGAVVAQVMVECLLVMAVGVALGLAAAFAIFALVADGIDLGAFDLDKSLAQLGMRPQFVPVLTSSDVVLVAALSLALGAVASLYPALRAVRVPPLAALSGGRVESGAKRRKRRRALERQVRGGTPARDPGGT